MLTLRNLSLQRGGKPLFENVSFTIHAGHKVGVIGANGSGKSSLFSLLQGEIHQDAGDLEMPPGMIVAHVAQETPALAIPAIEYVLEGDRELREIETALAAERAGDGVRLAELYAGFDAIDGYSAPARAARLLAGLGFSAADTTKKVAEFSGGWRVRLNLARALMCRSDLLLLDEPTNHLDLDAVLWLEQWLKRYPGTLLLISHDRDFLDNVVERIVHLKNRQIRVYKGNYSAFEEQRAARLALQQAAFEKQQKEVAHLHRFVERFRAKATKARQAQSRLKALARMEFIAPAHVDSPFRFAFPVPEKLPNPLLKLEKLDVGYGGSPVLRNLNLLIEPGTRLGLLGPNGAGKSTLIKLLAGLLPHFSGRREEGQGLTVGYFAQHQLEQLRSDWSPLQHLQKLDSRASEQDLRDFLGGFGFGGEQALEATAPFSGGEKARLALALLVRKRPNLLLLDEPTNHLDLEMRHALTLALQDYQGAMVVVSHDRYLLRSTTDEFYLAADGQVQPFDGDLDDYRDWLGGRQRTAEDKTARPAANSAVVRREQKRLDAERRQQLAVKRRPLEQRIRTVEKTMERLNADKAEIESALAEPNIYAEAHKAQLKDLVRRQGRIVQELERTEEEWLSLHEDLESIASDGETIGES